MSQAAATKAARARGRDWLLAAASCGVAGAGLFQLERQLRKEAEALGTTKQHVAQASVCADGAYALRSRSKTPWGSSVLLARRPRRSYMQLARPSVWPGPLLVAQQQPRLP
jgi:hypothetical protein